MTSEKKLSTVKKLLEINDTENDEVLSAYLAMAGDAILRKMYPFKEIDTKIVPDRYSLLQCDIAVYLYQKRGAEGEMTHTENGITRVYENGSIPITMLAQVMPYVGVF